MSRTLNMLDHLLERGRHLQQLGRTEDAVAVLDRLTGFQELPANIAEEAWSRLAEMQRKRGELNVSRRHLSAALVVQPRSALYHRLMAEILETVEEGDTERALEHYRQALEIEPDDALVLSAFGRLALNLGHEEEGLAALERAAELAPDEPLVLSRLARGLHDLGRTDAARSLLRAAMFRHGRDARFRRTWQEFQFAVLGDAQRQERHTADDVAGRPSMVLPFTTERNTTEPSNPPAVRRDGASRLRAPHLPRVHRYSGKKHA